MKKSKLNLLDLQSSIYKESFYEFLKAFWFVVVAEEPIYNWHMKVLCDEMQEAAELVFANQPKEYDMIINVPPGTSKSTICSIMFPAWVWTRMPSARIICGSYSHHLSSDLSRKCRDVIKSDLYRKLFPGVEIRADQDTKAYFMNTAGGMRYSVGTGGSVTGMHAHFILVDDPVDPQMANSDIDIKNANEWMSETLSQRKVSREVTLTVLIMQRLHQNDPTGHRLGQKSAGPVRQICLPAELSENVKPRKYSKFYGKKGLLDSKRFTKKVLKQEYGRLGEFGYAGQMMQTPVPRGGAMFKVDNLILEESTIISKMRQIVRFWDKAGTAKGGAFTVGVKMGIDYNNDIWVLDVVRGQWEAATRESVIYQTAMIDGYGVEVGIEQEPGSSGKESAQNTVRKLLGFKVKMDPATGDKETRADTFATQVNAGVVHILNRPWTQEYISELRFFPMSTYKDQVDASSGACAMISKPTIRIGVF